ncbi:conserved Plasmodium protein, unknown function [Plasmodium relictum]|uniref:Uncharacterized protein n=1 Tax=Plasmodium relictum TaxID=85471 RepID=A0A1J1HC87_PLARL|nr:conserved Plasmodium protein, unknown function [Plasmodium relictum]CRH02710.1 conserved Plasmodium protein, unknown function [Plasmodium relictum]
MYIEKLNLNSENEKITSLDFQPHNKLNRLAISSLHQIKIYHIPIYDTTIKNKVNIELLFISNDHKLVYINTIRWSFNGQYLASCDSGGTIVCYELDKDKNNIKKNMEEIKNNIKDGNNKSNNSFYTSTCNKEEWKITRCIKIHESGEIFDLAWSHDNEHVVCGVSKGVVYIFNLKNSYIAHKLFVKGTTENIKGVSFHPTNNSIIAQSSDNIMCVWKKVNIYQDKSNVCLLQSKKNYDQKENSSQKYECTVSSNFPNSQSISREYFEYTYEENMNKKYKNIDTPTIRHIYFDSFGKYASITHIPSNGRNCGILLKIDNNERINKNRIFLDGHDSCIRVAKIGHKVFVDVKKKKLYSLYCQCSDNGIISLWKIFLKRVKKSASNEEKEEKKKNFNISLDKKKLLAKKKKRINKYAKCFLIIQNLLEEQTCAVDVSWSENFDQLVIGASNGSVYIIQINTLKLNLKPFYPSICLEINEIEKKTNKEEKEMELKITKNKQIKDKAIEKKVKNRITPKIKYLYDEFGNIIENTSSHEIIHILNCRIYPSNNIYIFPFSSLKKKENNSYNSIYNFSSFINVFLSFIFKIIDAMINRFQHFYEKYKGFKNVVNFKLHNNKYYKYYYNCRNNDNISSYIIKDGDNSGNNNYDDESNNNNNDNNNDNDNKNNNSNNDDNNNGNNNDNNSDNNNNGNNNDNKNNNSNNDDNNNGNNNDNNSDNNNNKNNNNNSITTTINIDNKNNDSKNKKVYKNKKNKKSAKGNKTTKGKVDFDHSLSNNNSFSVENIHNITEDNYSSSKQSCYRNSDDNNDYNSLNQLNNDDFYEDTNKKINVKILDIIRNNYNKENYIENCDATIPIINNEMCNLEEIEQSNNSDINKIDEYGKYNIDKKMEYENGNNTKHKSDTKKKTNKRISSNEKKETKKKESKRESKKDIKKDTKKDVENEPKKDTNKKTKKNTKKDKNLNDSDLEWENFNPHIELCDPFENKNHELMQIVKNISKKNKEELEPTIYKKKESKKKNGDDDENKKNKNKDFFSLNDVRYLDLSHKTDVKRNYESEILDENTKYIKNAKSNKNLKLEKEYIDASNIYKELDENKYVNDKEDDNSIKSLSKNKKKKQNKRLFYSDYNINENTKKRNSYKKGKTEYYDSNICLEKKLTNIIKRDKEDGDEENHYEIEEKDEKKTYKEQVEIEDKEAQGHEERENEVEIRDGDLEIKDKEVENKEEGKLEESEEKKDEVEIEDGEKEKEEEYEEEGKEEEEIMHKVKKESMEKVKEINVEHKKKNSKLNIIEKNKKKKTLKKINKYNNLNNNNTKAKNKITKSDNTIENVYFEKYMNKVFFFDNRNENCKICCMHKNSLIKKKFCYLLWEDEISGKMIKHLIYDNYIFIISHKYNYCMLNIFNMESKLLIYDYVLPLNNISELYVIKKFSIDNNVYSFFYIHTNKMYYIYQLLNYCNITLLYYFDVSKLKTNVESINMNIIEKLENDPYSEKKKKKYLKNYEKQIIIQRKKEMKEQMIDTKKGKYLKHQKKENEEEKQKEKDIKKLIKNITFYENIIEDNENDIISKNEIDIKNEINIKEINLKSDKDIKRECFSNFPISNGSNILRRFPSNSNGPIKTTKKKNSQHRKRNYFDDVFSSNIYGNDLLYDYIYRKNNFFYSYMCIYIYLKNGMIFFLRKNLMVSENYENFYDLNENMFENNGITLISRLDNMYYSKSIYCDIEDNCEDIEIKNNEQKLCTKKSNSKKVNEEEIVLNRHVNKTTNDNKNIIMFDNLQKIQKKGMKNLFSYKNLFNIYNFDLKKLLKHEKVYIEEKKKKKKRKNETNAHKTSKKIEKIFNKFSSKVGGNQTISKKHKNIILKGNAKKKKKIFNSNLKINMNNNLNNVKGLNSSSIFNQFVRNNFHYINVSDKFQKNRTHKDCNENIYLKTIKYLEVQMKYSILLMNKNNFLNYLHIYFKLLMEYLDVSRLQQNFLYFMQATLQHSQKYFSDFYVYYENVNEPYWVDTNSLLCMNLHFFFLALFLYYNFLIPIYNNLHNNQNNQKCQTFLKFLKEIQSYIFQVQKNFQSNFRNIAS